MKHLIGLCLITFLLYGCSDKIVRVACIGDSITEGAGISDQSRNSYPVALNSFLGSKYAVLNSGRSATTLLKSGDFPYWTSKEFTNTFMYEPHIIVIKLGTNDTKPQNWNSKAFEKDYQSLIDTLKTIRTKPRLILCLPVPVYHTEWGINDSTLVSGVLPILHKLADKNNLELVDLYEGMKNKPELFPDHIHPNEQGAKNLAFLVSKQILGK